MRIFSSGRKVDALRRIDDQSTAGKPLPKIIVGLAFQFEGDALGEKRAETLAGRPVEAEADDIAGKPLGPVAASDFAGEHGAHGAVHIANRQADVHRRQAFESRAREVDQFMIEGGLQAVILSLDAPAGDAAGGRRVVENGG